MRRLLPTVSALICACGTSTATAIGADLVAKGIYRSSTSIQETATIPAVLGTSFGVAFRVNRTPGLRPPSTTVTWRFPAAGLSNPNTKRTSHRVSYECNCVIEEMVCKIRWRFDHPWELVPGVWEVEIAVDHRTAIKESFTVVEP
jgi:hypothetical protein